MDVIASVAFATQVDSQNNPDDPFVCHAQMFFSFSFFRPIMLLFSKYDVKHVSIQNVTYYKTKYYRHKM